MSLSGLTSLSRQDPEVDRLIRDEQDRLENTLDLIAAESITPPAIMAALGSIFNTKTVEGYPGRRFHAGCRYADDLEELAVSRGKQLFGAEHVNVQPHCGSTANLAVYASVLNPGDRVLSMKLSHGGHLSHGASASITGRYYQFQHYGLARDTETIDYDQLAETAAQFHPNMIVAGASAYSRLIDYKRLGEIAKAVSAYLLVDMAHIAGLVAAGVIPSPVPYSDFVTFTTYKTMMGGRGGVIISRNKYRKRIDAAIFPGSQGTPAMNQIAAKAVCFKLAMSPDFKQIQERILDNAICFADAFDKKGYRVVSEKTENHLVLLDLRSKGLTGDRAETLLESVGIIANKNVIPHDPQPANVTSGFRIGSTAITARGMGLTEVGQIVDWIDAALSHSDQQEILDEISEAVSQLSRRFPIYKS
jgi:glycine hydroxymethyltransferase